MDGEQRGQFPRSRTLLPTQPHQRTHPARSAEHRGHPGRDLNAVLYDAQRILRTHRDAQPALIIECLSLSLGV